MGSVKINCKETYSLDEIELLSRESRVDLSPADRARLQKTFQEVQRLAERSKPIYGVNTGFGKLATVRIAPTDLKRLQENLVRSHASGIGRPLRSDVVRRLLVLRVLSLGKGYSGISPAILERHLAYLQLSEVPEIPEQGSVGASGDLAPLAHLALTFMGEGAFLSANGKRVPASKILTARKWKRLSLGAKEGLALVNGTQVSLALALQVREELKSLIPWMEMAAALSVEGHRGSARVFLPEIHALKKHKYQWQVAKRMTTLLASSAHVESHQHDCELVQDAYSFRCIPQVVGPVYSLFEKAEEFLQAEANSVSDNPLYLSEEKDFFSSGHFHAHAVSFAADLYAMGMTTLGNLIERRIDQMMNPGTTRHRAFLASKPGVESGLMIVQTAAAALASENRTLVHPASADNIPTNGDQEDHVSMAPWAARKAHLILGNLRKLIAAEVLVAVRACQMERQRSKAKFSPAVERTLTRLKSWRGEIFETGDRVFSEDWRALESLLLSLDQKIIHPSDLHS